VHPRQRDALASERGLDVKFAIDGVGTGQQRPGRLLAQDIGTVAGMEVIGRVGLATLELANDETVLDPRQSAVQERGPDQGAETRRCASGPQGEAGTALTFQQVG